MALALKPPPVTYTHEEYFVLEEQSDTKHVIHQSQILIEYHHKVSINRWLLTEYADLEDTLVIQAIEFSITLRRIYARVGGLAA